MPIVRRHFLHLAAGAAAFPLVSRIARAQVYPTRQMRIVVGFTPGGAADTTMRIVGQWLSERFGQPVIIENKPGAGTNLSVQAALNAPPDGYTLLFVSGSQAINASLYEALPFNFLRDFSPVALVADVPLVMVVHPAVSADTVTKFVELAKANPGKVRMASFGVGSPSHLAGERFKAIAGVDIIHVPYRGSAPALIDLIGGRVEVMFDTVLASGPHIRSGALRSLALTGKTRSELLPGVPTVSDTIPGYEASGWQGIAVRKGTSSEIVKKLNAEINAGLANATTRARLVELATYPRPLTPIEFGIFMEAETEKWAKVVRAAGIRAE
jgi:tripartite-type tricarboxylate transporter receptor subunit TctC